MDFFEAQAHAKKRTSRLVWLFALAVAGTIAATYFFAVLIANALQDRGGHRHHYEYRNSKKVWVMEEARADPMMFWQPKVFVWTAGGVLAIVGLASLIKWGQYAAGGRAVAESVGGRAVDPRTTDTAERRLLNVVEEMSIASGVPVPATYLLEDEHAINAFAAGLTTSDAAVCVTRGTMEKLTRDELQGVIGHEFSHILNGDMRLNLRIGAIVFGILVLGLAGRGLLWSLRNINFGKNSAPVIIALLVCGLTLMVIGYVGYFFGRLIQAAVSRQREFLADASAVQFTRNPGGLTGALKKIAGYALGSSLQTHKAAEIGHFFFAQGFSSAFAGLWATHPPLDERIRAIEPRFDGQFFEPPQVVDITKESFQTAGFAHPQAAAAAAAGSTVPPGLRSLGEAGPPRSAPPAPIRIPFHPTTAIANVGALAAEHFARAQRLLESLPVGLRDAARDPALAPVIVYGLLVDGPPDVRAKQQALVEKLDSPAAAAALAKLRPALSLVDAAARLPLLQLCTPALRTLDAAALDRFVSALDELVYADGVVTPFEFALQKTLLRSLALGRAPAGATVQIYSFNAVTEEISVVLSALAHASSADATEAARAFATGAAQIKLIEASVALLEKPACDLAKLDAALDKLATTSLIIKQRTLVAAAHVIGADGQVLIEEAELLRAISAALDCPMAPLAVAA